MEKAPIMKRISRSANNEEEGYILIMGIFIMLILMIMGVALAVMGLQEFELASRVKMMDQAYLIADSGINSAAVALETNDAYRQALSPVYGGSSSITTGTNPDFGGYGSATGTYTYWVYQSEQNPTDAGYKVIKSKGTITSQGKTVERIILARIVLSAGGTDYDASFDYLMYNGMDSNGDGVSERGIWAPTSLRFLGSIIAGQFGFDGSNNYLGHFPKGAFYVAGSINIPSSVVGYLNIKGRIVAEDNITLKNSWAIDTGVSGIKVDGNAQVPGNVVAGINPVNSSSGNANVSVVATLSGSGSAISVSGIVGASGSIAVSSTANFLNSPLSVGGLYAGKDVDIGGTANISAAMNVGTIRSGNQTNIQSTFSGVTANNISAGQTRSTDSVNTGVYLDTVAGSISTGNITSTGMVDVKVRVGSISLGALSAGNNTTAATGGKGVQVDLMVAGVPINGNITSTGLVNLKAVGISTITATGNITAGNSLTSASPVTNTGVYFDGTILSTIVCTGAIASNGDVIAVMASGSHINTGNIWSGRNVDLQGGEWVGFDDSITTGQIDAKGFVSLVTGDNITTNGYVKSEKWVKIWSIASLLSGMNEININGNIYAGSAAIPDFTWTANGLPYSNRTESGWTVYVNDSNDIPAFSDNLTITGAISSVGNVTVLGQDTVQTGDIASNGNVRISHNYDWVGNSNNYVLGSITAGGYIDIYSDVELTGADDSIHTGSLSAVGAISVQGHDPIVTNAILSNSNVTMRSTWKDITPGNYIQNNGSIQCGGSLDWYGCALNLDPDSWISGGVWAGGNVTIKRSDAVDASDTDMTIGYIGGSDCVRTKGYLRMTGAGDIGYEDIQCPNESWTGASDGDLRYGTGQSLDDVTYRDLYGSYNTSPPTYTHSSVDPPSVATPGIPTKPTAPLVGQGKDIDVLGLAGLTAPVKLLKPNWAYFETLAKQNDVANGPETKICPNLNCRRTVASTNPGGYPPVFPSNCPYCGTSLSGVNPGPAHMVYENGPGDQDHDTAGIQFKWDNTTPYSSNETVYNGDPDVAIYITELNWDPNAATYTGTIVSRGNVYITAPTPDWIIDTGQNLNLVSGWDIINSSNGLSLIQRTDSQLHLWAQHDIRFDLMQITIASQHDFFGSFTAGDKVVYNSNSLWENTTFKWSRWALDPVAWAPPFRVLDWKEL